MESRAKRKLIRRMAIVVGVVLVLSAAGVAGALLGARNAWDAWQREARWDEEQMNEETRSYLAAMAKRITRLPVDRAVLGDAESKYYEGAPRRRRYVWGIGGNGEFLFGVPSEPFARLNAIYDRNPEIQRDGHFASRQEFLRDLILAHDEIGFEPVRENGWRRLRDHRDRASVFSTPVRAEGGDTLGTLYAKVEGAVPDYGRSSREAWVHAAGTFAVLGGLAAAFLWFLLPTWVYVDGREHGIRRPMLWSFLVLISGLLGLVVYLIGRPEAPQVLRCPECRREVNGGAFCPHCGRDLAGTFCAACRYPLKSGWVFCPSCRAPLAPPTAAPGSASAEAQPAPNRATRE